MCAGGEGKTGPGFEVVEEWNRYGACTRRSR
jgi:hypothetical protein